METASEPQRGSTIFTVGLRNAQGEYVTRATSDSGVQDFNLKLSRSLQLE